MDSDTLREIRARADAATGGPWLFQPWGGQNQNGDYAESILCDEPWSFSYYGIGDDDGEFIAAARSDVPALLDYIEQLEERAAEQRARILDFIDEVEQLEVALQLRAALLRDMRRIEYGVARPASMPEMSGRETWTLIVSATFRSLDDAETAQRNVPALRDREAVIVQRRAPGDWERAREGSTP